MITCVPTNENNMSRARQTATCESVDYSAPSPRLQNPVQAVLGLVKDAYRRCMYVSLTPQQAEEMRAAKARRARAKFRVAA